MFAQIVDDWTIFDRLVGQSKGLPHPKGFITSFLSDEFCYKCKQESSLAVVLSVKNSFVKTCDVKLEKRIRNS